MNQQYFEEEFKKEDSLSQIAFIVDATARFRNAFQEMEYQKHFIDVDAADLFDALRVEMFRISTLDIANSDFIIEDAGMPSLRGSVDSWLLYAGKLFEQWPSSQQEIHNRWEILSAQTRVF